MTRAVVIVSGGAAVSPFTTPERGCGGGTTAGSTDTGLREALSAAGFPVFTSPANVGSRPVTHDADFGGFTDPPEVLPVEFTVNAVGDIDEAGVRLASFLTYLADRERLATVDLVCHSMGGLFARSAIRRLGLLRSSLRIGSLTTLGTPSLGAFPADFALGDLSLEDARGHEGTEVIMRDFAELVATASEGAGEQVTRSYLSGPKGWNERQGDQLGDVPVTLIAGDHFRHDAGRRDVFPHDGMVTVRSAFAEGVPPTVLRPRGKHLFPDVHSIFVAEQFGLPWPRALTWDPDVMAVVVDALRDAGA